MKIFYDTEFIDDGRTIEFISIGMVREDGQELYCVTESWATMNRAANRKQADGYWLKDNVLKHLPVNVLENEGMLLYDLHPVPGAKLLPADKYYVEFDDKHPDFKYVLPRDAISDKVRRFIIETPNVQLWAWYAAYDHVALAQLFGSMQDLPYGVPMYTNDLKQEHVRLGSPHLPRQKEGNHNALADARHNQVVSRALENIILGRA